MSIYNIDWVVLRRQLLPVRLRDSGGVLRLLRMKWLAVLTKPVELRYIDFMAFRTSTLYKLAHNGQVCYLEAVANDAFDAVDRTIYITDGEFESALVIYLQAELQPKPIYLAIENMPEAVYTAAEIYGDGMDFIVHVPNAVAVSAGYDEDRLRQLINDYKLDGMRFSIVIEP
jgi:hypothetical protein